MGLKKSKMSTNPIKRLSEGINYYLNNKYKHAGNVNKKSSWERRANRKREILFCRGDQCWITWDLWGISV